MTGEEKAERPNANYRLSKGESGNLADEENLQFHYKREERLAKAPQAVRELYAEKKPARFSLFRPFASNKPMPMLFLTILALCATLIVLSKTGALEKAHSLDGAKIEITGTRFEGTAIIVVRKTLKKENSALYTGAVDVAVSPAVKSMEEEYPVFYHRIFFSAAREEEYRFAVPFDSEELAMVLQTEKSSLKIKLKPE
ncbi:MAG: hypothetical protein LBU82_08290 [Treponema sp.]|jgi:hypothetical protein|nr:hypothetical protein [Treponema sp.]